MSFHLRNAASEGKWINTIEYEEENEELLIKNNEWYWFLRKIQTKIFYKDNNKNILVKTGVDE